MKTIVIACFALWAFTNASWACLDFGKDLVAQGVLQTIYLGLSVYGLWRWGRLGRVSATITEGTK